MGVILYKMERFKATFWQNMAGSDLLAYQTASLALGVVYHIYTFGLEKKFAKRKHLTM